MQYKSGTSRIWPTHCSLQNPGLTIGNPSEYTDFSSWFWSVQHSLNVCKCYLYSGRYGLLLFFKHHGYQVSQDSNQIFTIIKEFTRVNCEDVLFQSPAWKTLKKTLILSHYFSDDISLYSHYFSFYPKG